MQQGSHTPLVSHDLGSLLQLRSNTLSVNSAEELEVLVALGLPQISVKSTLGRNVESVLNLGFGAPVHHFSYAGFFIGDSSRIVTHMVILAGDYSENLTSTVIRANLDLYRADLLYLMRIRTEQLLAPIFGEALVNVETPICRRYVEAQIIKEQMSKAAVQKKTANLYRN